MTARIEPLSEPFAPEVAERPTALMPGGGEPIRLFRTFERDLPMAAGLNAWGRYDLSRQLSLTLRDRELVIEQVHSIAHPALAEPKDGVPRLAGTFGGSSKEVTHR